MEKISTHSERKTELVESLTLRVRATHELLKKVEELSTLTSKEATAAIDKLLVELPSLFPEQTRNKRTLLADLQAEYAKLSDDDESIVDYDSADYDITDFELENELETKLDILQTRINELMEDPDTMYLDVVEKGLKHLQEKARLVDYDGTQELSSNPSIIHTDTDPFSIVNVVKESEWTEGKSYGYHVRNTPNIFIRESVFNNADKYQETLAHERIHNALDGIATHSPVNPVQHISSRLKQISRLTKLKAPEIIIEHELAKLAHPRYLDHLLDFTHNELLAYWDSHENTALDNRSAEEVLLVIFDAHEKLTNYRISKLATAGKHLKETMSILEKLPAELSKSGHTEAAAGLENMHRDFKHKIMKMIQLTRNQARKAESLGPGALEDRRALMYLLPPSKYRHIDTYLDATYSAAPENDD